MPVLRHIGAPVVRGGESVYVYLLLRRSSLAALHGKATPYRGYCPQNVRRGFQRARRHAEELQERQYSLNSDR